ncbi:general transcription factor 3C polypeptide 5 [Neocloeon triangulifer]|uniref:general transcription factor 3C polypeptide 5 n=1 Tax=Neocloeon triangulifer TaxID=2078957 RepID=UPI00286F0E9C|nr:general transcription factor 3C polypeptide 5 [Neocloeon triangulifer]
MNEWRVSEHDFLQEITCVKFPGVVKDSGVAKAIQALGGTASLSQAISKSHKLELNFNADSVFHKSVFGERERVPAVLLRVKRKTYEAKVVGIVNTCYNFKSMCDFQFLPNANPDTSVFPLSTVPDPDSLLRSDATVPPLYFPSCHLSKMDTPSPYCYSNRSNSYGNRPSRRNHTQRVPFTLNAPLPSTALPGAMKVAQSRKLDHIVTIVKDLFDKRPIWTRAALLNALGLDKTTFSAVIPCIAFFFLGGPWRLTWCRHGYDPRTDPAARYWQIIEFRAQSIDLRKHLKLRTGEKENPVFTEGQIPSQLNSLFQLVDVHVKEVQNLLLSVPFKICQEKHGWVTAGTIDKIRKIIDEKATDAVVMKYGRTVPVQACEEQDEDSDDSLVVLSNQSAAESADSTDLDSDDET